MFSSENHVGRLIEMRIVTPFAEAEVAELLQRHLAVVAGVGGEVVFAVDLRRAQVLPPAIADRFVQLMGQVNPALLRSGLLINDSAVFGLQAERAVAEAGNPERKVFRSPEDMERWLGGILTGAELRRLREFLSE
jgi:hypothetical protein